MPLPFELYTGITSSWGICGGSRIRYTFELSHRDHTHITDRNQIRVPEWGHILFPWSGPDSHIPIGNRSAFRSRPHPHFSIGTRSAFLKSTWHIDSQCTLIYNKITIFIRLFNMHISMNKMPFSLGIWCCRCAGSGTPAHIKCKQSVKLNTTQLIWSTINYSFH